MTATKVCLVTGASSGIGYAAAAALLERGHTVYAAARRLEPMAGLSAAGGHVVQMDVTDESSVRAGTERVLAEQGRIDGLVAAAGYLHMGMIENVGIDAAQHQFDVNVFGVARAVKAVLPSMRAQGGGSIVVVSSALGKFSAPGMAWYPASKHALEAFCDSLRLEVKRFDVKVAMIEPAFVATDLFRAGRYTLDVADQAEHAEVYAREQAAFRINAANRFCGGSSVDQVTNSVVEALESDAPRRRYRPNWMSKLGVFAKEKIGDGLVDRISTYIWLRDTSPKCDVALTEQALMDRPTQADES
jgi:NAD(P)-dependent dehydrogenase (short-subunit alcohol dehydrogenase family)